jgi:ADP-ribose pyrophosphatase YjhB (NUDIX family)
MLSLAVAWLEYDMILFCSTCGSPTQNVIPSGDARPRDVCTAPACGNIHYENPRIVAGTLPLWEGKILLCKRAIEPRKGFWTLPAGFMELSETVEQGAVRETQEEAGTAISVRGLLSVLDVPHASQVHMFYLADMVDGSFCAGEESLEVALFEVADIPWADLAFKTVVLTLQHYLAYPVDTPLLTDVVTYPVKQLAP